MYKSLTFFKHCTSHTEIIYTDSERVRIRRGTTRYNKLSLVMMTILILWSNAEVTMRPSLSGDQSKQFTGWSLICCACSLVMVPATPTWVHNTDDRCRRMKVLRCVDLVAGLLVHPGPLVGVVVLVEGQRARPAPGQQHLPVVRAVPAHAHGAVRYNNETSRNFTASGRRRSLELSPY